MNMRVNYPSAVQVQSTGALLAPYRVQQDNHSSLESVAAPAKMDLAQPKKPSTFKEKFYDFLGTFKEEFFDFLGMFACLWCFGFDDYTPEKALQAYEEGSTWALRGMLFMGVYLIPKEGKSVAERAVEDDDVETLRLLQRQQPELRVKGMPLVFYAAQQKKVVSMATLLDMEGVYINKKLGDQTLLEIACRNKDVPSVLELLSRGADVSGLNRFHRFGIVHELIRLGQTEAAKTLIKQKVDLNYADADGQTPLAVAFAMNDRVMAQFLVKHGASYLSMDGKFPNLLLEAIRKDWPEVASDMLDNIPKMLEKDSEASFFGQVGLLPPQYLGAQDPQGRTPLMLACLKGYEDLAVKLIQKGAHLHEKDEAGQGAMHYVCQSGLREVFNTLVHKPGMHLHDADLAGNTPLSLAFGRRDIDMLRDLLYKRPKVQAGQTFMFDVFGRNGEQYRPILFAMIERGVGLDAQNLAGNTLMHEAAIRGDHEIIEALLAQGVSINILNRQGETPVQYVFRMKQFDKLAYLEGKGANMMYAIEQAAALEPEGQQQFMGAVEVPAEMQLCSACKQGDLDAVKQAQLLQANPKARDSEGLLPIHHAALNGHVTVVQYLRMGMVSLTDDDARTAEGQTLLHLAVKGGHTALVQMIIDDEGLLDEKDFEGNTALRLAYKAQNKDLVELLKKAGADPKKVPEEERFPVDHSILHRMKKAISSSTK